MDEITITRTFNGRRHVGYVVTNDLGASAVVYESRKRGWFVRTESDLILTDSLIAARDLAISLV